MFTFSSQFFYLFVKLLIPYLMLVSITFIILFHTTRLSYFIARMHFYFILLLFMICQDYYWYRFITDTIFSCETSSFLPIKAKFEVLPTKGQYQEGRLENNGFCCPKPNLNSMKAAQWKTREITDVKPFSFDTIR